VTILHQRGPQPNAQLDLCMQLYIPAKDKTEHPPHPATRHRIYTPAPQKCASHSPMVPSLHPRPCSPATAGHQRQCPNSHVFQKASTQKRSIQRARKRQVRTAYQRKTRVQEKKVKENYLRCFRTTPTAAQLRSTRRTARDSACIANKGQCTSVLQHWLLQWDCFREL
jgi:hypothetical protein